jgi:hypothetical protein
MLRALQAHTRHAGEALADRREVLEVPDDDEHVVQSAPRLTSTLTMSAPELPIAEATAPSEPGRSGTLIRTRASTGASWSRALRRPHAV